MNDIQIAYSTTCLFLALVGSGVGSAYADEKVVGARVVKFYGYEDCLRLENGSTRVTLCPAAGGRVLEYSFKGKNALYLPPGGEGWTYEPGKRGGSMVAGRFDIGPEQTIPKHPQLWMGRWSGQIIGPRSARLLSAKDKPTGVQLTREFTLDEHSSRLECKQTITNISISPKNTAIGAARSLWAVESA